MEKKETARLFYAKRSLGDTLNYSVDFVKNNLKCLLKFMALLILPWNVIQAILMWMLSGALIDFAAIADSTDVFAIAGLLGVKHLLLYGGMMLVSVGAGTCLIALFFSLLKLNYEREGGLTGLRFQELKPLYVSNVFKGLRLFAFHILLGLVIALLMGLLAGISPWVVLAFIPFLFIFMLPLALLMPAYMLEKQSFFKTLASSYRMGFITWGGVFAVLLVMAIIAGLIQLAASAPWYIVTMVEYVFSLSENAATESASVGFNILSGFMALFLFFGQAIGLLFIYSGMGYQFGHASVKSQEIKVTDQIDSF